MLEGNRRCQNVGSLIRHSLLGFHGSLTQTLLKDSISSVFGAQPRPPCGRGDASEAKKRSLRCHAPFNGRSQTQALILLEPAYLFPSPPSPRTQSAFEINYYLKKKKSMKVRMKNESCNLSCCLVVCKCKQRDTVSVRNNMKVAPT